MLAIAGLIFLMVFIALPALQRSQRDTQRRDDMSRFMSAIQNYQSNNNGKIPTQTELEGASGSTATPTFLKDYLKQDDGEFEDPNGTKYKVSIKDVPANDAAVVTAGTVDNTIYFVRNAKCTDGKEGVPTAASGDRNYAIYYKLEGAGVYCGDNS